MIYANELIVDAFCGGGGASEGIRRATGRSPDIAINHDEEAILMHEANHPETMHLRESIWTVDPHKVTKGAPVGLLWASPDCTHFSRAKGGKPVNRRRRSLANVVVKWAKQTSPRFIRVENVPEFQTWGPLGKDNKPIAARSGEYFRRWVRSFERMGYTVDWKTLVAADYGAPTTRKRLFVAMNRDGVPVLWPAKTHGKGTPNPWQAVSTCIDWSIPCPSIFDRKKKLADATLRRIARGIMKYVINNPKPFIVNMSHGGKIEQFDNPMSTIKTERGGCRALVSPIIAGCGGRAGQTKPRPGSEPMYTITKKADTAVVSPVLVNTRNGERLGQEPRVRDIEDPAPAVTARGSQGALAVANLLKHYGAVTGQPMEAPLGTVTTVDHHSVTIAHGLKMYGTSIGQDLQDPAHTITGQGLHAGVVAAFLQEYYGNGNPLSADAPIPTIVTKDRVALVTIEIEGSTYVIVDIGMRMLKPRELARAQGFQDEYKLTGNQSNQVAKIGNSVVPQCAEAIVRAQLGGAPVEEAQPNLFQKAA
jgi:DNA (cytosine-5)-methyltransferase 1